MPAQQSHIRSFIFIFAVIVSLTGSPLLAAKGGSDNAEPRYRVFALKHISVDQARKYLSEAKLGTVSQLPTTNMILVTAQSHQLIKAGAIMQVVDSERPYVMKALFPASTAAKLPLNEQIAAEVGDMAIGGFSNPPSGIGKTKAIIDIHDDAVVVVAPADQLQNIIKAIEKYDTDGSLRQLLLVDAEALQVSQPVAAEDTNLPEEQKTVEPVEKKEPNIMPVSEAELERVKAELQKVKDELNHRNGISESEQGETDAEDSESNGLFGKLLDSIAEAEKKVTDLAEPVAGEPEPNEPAVEADTVVAAPEETEPNEPTVEPVAVVAPTEESEPNEPPVVLEQPEEKVVEPVKEAEKPEPVKPVAEKVSTKLPSKPEPNAVPEQTAVKVEEPNQVAAITQEEPNEAGKVVEPAAARGPYEPAVIANGNDMLELELPPKINIIDLLDLVGKYLGLDYMYDPADITGLKGEVTLVLQGPIKVKDLYPLAESVLKFKGFVMTRRTNLVTIVPLVKAPDIDAPIVDPDKPGVEAGDVIITQIFRLKHIDTASVQNLLTGMKLGINFSPIAEMGIIIISEYAYRMERIERLVELIDIPGEEKKFRFRALEYTTATTLAAKVKTLAEQLGTVSITVAAPTTTTAALPTIPTRPGTRITTPPRLPTRTTTPTTPTAKPTETSVYLDADERTNRILMIGLEEQLAVVDSLIDALDVEQKDLRTLRLYEIQHVDAEEVRIKLEELGIISAGRGTATSGRTAYRTPTRTQTRTTPTRTTPTGAPGAAPATSTAAIEEPLAEEAQVVIIEPTNSLLVNGTAEQHVQIATIIGYVDSSQEESANPYVIYPLENQDPEELAGVLEKLIQETVTEQGAADSKVVRTTTRKKIEEDIFIVADPKTYSLIVYASKKNQQWISSLIEELDKYRPQVLLDCTLVEVTRDDEFAYDLDIISQIVPGADTMQYFTESQNSFLSEFPRNTIGEAINTGAGLGNFPGAGGQGFLAKGQVQVLFKVMEYRGYGRVLARPKLLVNDNEEGTITTEDTIYIAEKQTKYIPTTTAPGSTPGYSPDTSVTFKPYNAGIELTIQPHISKGSQLQLTITLNRTDFDLAGEKTVSIGDEEFPKPLDTRMSNVQTIVTVPDGKTIILGGLEKTTQSKGGGKVPILGDIPLIGGLFRSAANASVQSRLYVFVKAHILRPGQEFTGISDIEVVSLKNRATFEKFEKEMQDYEDWPGIKPKPMDPEKVLEEDEDRVVSVRDRKVFDKGRKGTKENGVKFGRKSQPIELNQAPERDATISLKNGLDKSKKEVKEGEDLPGTKPKPMHPMQLLEFN